MSELEQLEQRVRMLSPQDLASFRAWFLEFDRHAQAHGQSGAQDRLGALAQRSRKMRLMRPSSILKRHFYCIQISSTHT